MITQKRLKECLHYDPETGDFIWRINKGSRGKSGSVAGSLNKSNGYIDIIFDTERYTAHRLAFLYMIGRFPKVHTDHINGARSDNKWDNLREVTPLENHKNHKLHKANKSGFNGVCWLKAPQKWQVQVKVNYKTIHIGLFDDKEKAIAARKQADIDYGFHENHGRANLN